MKKRKFEAHDKVRVYATLNGTKAESIGMVLGTRIDGMLIIVLKDGLAREIVAHPKQCRRLVKKPKKASDKIIKEIRKWLQ